MVTVILFFISWFIVGALIVYLTEKIVKNGMYLWEFFLFTSVWPLFLLVGLLTFILFCLERFKILVTPYWQQFLKIKI